MKNIYILAQAGEEEVITGGNADEQAQENLTVADSPNGGGPDGKPEGEGPRPGFPIQYFFIIGLVVLMFMMFRGPKKKQQQQKKMIQSLKRNDRIRTIGGILGTVVDVKDDEITLIVDESNNTKIKVTSAAISKVLSNETV